MKNRKKRWISRAAILAALAVVCVTGGGARALSQYYFHQPLNYPRVDGSTSTHPLDMVMACEKNGAPWAWVSPGVDWRALQATGPELRVTPVISDPGDPAQRALADQIKMRVNHRGTNQGYAALIEKQADLILVARAPSEDELKLAKDKGVVMETTAIARDALVFIVNKQNPMENLTMAQLRGIYSGKIKSWTETGWIKDERAGAATNTISVQSFGMRRSANFKDMDIVSYTRNRNSGSRELLDSMVMKGLPAIESVEERDPSMTMMEMYPVIDTIAEDLYGICYTVYYYEEFMYKSAAVKKIAVDGVAPTAETIGSGKYPLTADVYAVVRKDEAPGSPARSLLEWILSEAGQKAVAKSGYVPIRK